MKSIEFKVLDLKESRVRNLGRLGYDTVIW
jgi:hypothetical protein